MTGLLLLVACAVVAIVSSELTPEMREQLYEIQNKCMQETGATDEMIMNAYGGVFTDAPELAEQLVCCAKSGGMVDEDGQYHKDILRNKLLMFVTDEAKIDAAIEKCLIEMPTIQETVLSGAKCMFKEVGE